MPAHCDDEDFSAHGDDEDLSAHINDNEPPVFNDRDGADQFTGFPLHYQIHGDDVPNKLEAQITNILDEKKLQYFASYKKGENE